MQTSTLPPLRVLDRGAFSTIALTRGFEAVVDEADHEWLSKWKWHARPTPDGGAYAVRRRLASDQPGSAFVLMHRVVAGVDGERSVQVDHLNQDGLDNTRRNLRICSHQQNMRNRRKLAPAASRFKGVVVTSGRWRAHIYKDRKELHLGYFDTEEMAARAYDAAALELFGEFARTNF